ncbi:uncharacterized protein N7477_000724 [Penicillium maclennaniae]|uniref:uncharacterized protein n=1 Tax=Penicillium maclennaniae TaxID=1343394 RepID=UPI002540F875|nr:uncharacterized protein N7477_000724 [Penicillium maclennaniae]KAJ5684379.1 hypothetical protein N7477_000724 [Penicillium maclennaniae]
MFRQITARPLITANRAVAQRSFSVAVPGSVKVILELLALVLVVRQDSFTKREAAQEALYIREKEIEKLQQLKKKITDQRAHLDELEGHIDQLTKEQRK